MSQLNPDEVDGLLRAAGPGATVYLVGAGGCGMSGLGHLLLDLGYRVCGSDLVCNEETQQLAARGAQIHVGHAGEQLVRARPRLVVYSSAIRLENPELQAARLQQIPIVRRAVLLAALLHRQRGVCVAGMHGKTTTSAMLAFALEQLGAQPSYAVGAKVAQLRPSARFSARPEGEQAGWFVIESDESDGTLTSFRPEHAIVLNIDEEHLDYYANLEAICQEFEQFARQTRGTVLFCADDAHLAELFARHPRAVSYGFHALAHYRVEMEGRSGPARGWEEEGAGSAFAVWCEGECLGRFTLRLFGRQNVSNAAAVVAMLHLLGYQTPAIAEALAVFRGAVRRQEELFRDDRYRVVDDYGHHPSEIRATLQALRALGGRRLLVAFQPHRYTRTRHLLEEFSTSFGEADLLWVTEVYAASEDEIAGVNGERLAEAIRSRGGPPTVYTPGLEELGRQVRAALQPGDVVLFLGAGDITKAGQSLAEELRREQAKPSEQLYAALCAGLSPGAVVIRNETLARRTTMRVGGKADLYVEPATEEDVARLLVFCGEHQLPLFVLGRGSNLLIRDGGVRGVVMSLAGPYFSRLQVVGDRMVCGAGVKLKAVAVEARRHGLAGLEFLEGIPGSVGGALRMNAGAMGSWIFDVVETIRFIDRQGRVHERPAAEVHVEYRGCPLLQSHIALGAVLRGERAAPERIQERMQAFNARRWETQPAQPSAGCVFKNPPSVPAGKLIEELGLKGTRVGGAVVSEVHGNFIVNDGGATAQDVLNLIEIIKERARSMRGIELETEVEIIGD